MESYIIVCKIDTQWEFAICLRELKQRPCINLVGLDGEGDGREVQEGGDKCTPITESPQQKAMSLKMNSPGQYVPYMLLEISREIVPERMKR